MSKKWQQRRAPQKPVTLFLLTPSITVPLFKVVFTIRCATCNGWVWEWGGVGDVNVPCAWHMFDATQEYAVGCGGGEWCQRCVNSLTCLMLRKIMGSAGVWGMMLTFLDLCSHVWCYARLWAGVWGMMWMFIELCSHVWCYARLWAGVRRMMLTFLVLETCLMLRKNMRWGVGCGEWCQRSLNMLTCLMLRTQNYRLGCGEWC